MSTDIYEGHGIIITRFCGGIEKGVCYQITFESEDKGIAYVIYPEKVFWRLVDDLVKLKKQREYK